MRPARLTRYLRKLPLRRAPAPRKRTSIGAVEICTPAFLSGWCVDAEVAPSPVDVVVNGTHLARVAPSLSRTDLGPLGFHPDAGFMYLYPEPLTLDDTVEVFAADGRPLHGSPSTHHRERLSRLLSGIDPARMSGIEIGALDRPTLSKTRGELVYVDHASTEDLRRKYLGSPPLLLDPARIVAVDHVWPGGPLAACLPPGRTFDYCVAVQVLEHVADPIGWLGHVAEVIRPGGVIALALPERERCFDFRRETTRPADLVEAYLLKLERPSPRQVFDHAAYTCLLHLKGQEPPLHDPERLKGALDAAERSLRDGAYRDVHCSVFTVASFRECWSTIDALGLLPLDLEAIHEPYPGGEEFTVTLRRR